MVLKVDLLSQAVGFAALEEPESEERGCQHAEGDADAGTYGGD